MISRILLGVVLGAVAASVPGLGAQNTRVVTPITFGTRLCVEYTTAFDVARLGARPPAAFPDRSEWRQVLDNDVAWIDGFVTGTAFTRGLVEVGDEARYLVWFGNYCEDNPSSTINGAAARMVEALLPRTSDGR